VDPRDVLAGAVEITDASRRNRNHVVHVAGRPRYFVKRCAGVPGPGTVTHEARAYDWLAARGHAGGAPIAPGRVAWSAEEGILVLEAIDPAISAGVLSRREAGLSPRRAAGIGRALARLHALPLDDGALPVLPREWFLTVHLPTVTATQHMSFAALGLTRRIQRHGAFCRALDGLTAAWVPDTPINGDVKWDNILFRRRARGPGSRQPVLVDWEFLGRGDRAWDVASVVSEYLFAWTHTGLDRLGDEDGIDAALSFELGRHHAAIAAFWGGYVAASGLGRGAAAALLVKVVRFAAGRLVLKCFEAMQERSSGDAALDPTLQLAANLIERPQEAAVHLLSLDVAAGHGRA
jgi:hypothetical protein